MKRPQKARGARVGSRPDVARLPYQLSQPTLVSRMSARPHSLLRTAAAPLLLLAAGCSGTVVSTSDASTSSTQALLSVERTASVGDPVASARAHASAYFLRMQAGADQNLAARLVGASNLLPPLGQCQQVEVLGEQGMPLASLGPVDLIDVGDVALEASQTR